MGMADEEQQVVEQEVEVAEEEADLVDPMVEIKEKCSQTKACAALFEKLTSCNTQVASKTETTETCVEEESDFLHCVDHCLQNFSSILSKWFPLVHFYMDQFSAGEY